MDQLLPRPVTPGEALLIQQNNMLFQHMNNSGKEEITSRVVEAITTTQGKPTESSPISLTCKDTNKGITSTKIDSGKQNWHQE
jgi:hypothetical protein